MFREIRVREIKETKNDKNQAYLNIKPETDITTEEADNFWAVIFQQVHEEAVRGEV